MKFALLALALMCSGLLLSLAGCSTDQPGTTNTLGTYTSSVGATPDKVTSAAKASLDDLKMQGTVMSGTKVDGVVTGRTAQGDDIKIDIVQDGDNVSKVTIRVGTTGDDAISKQILDGIKKHL